LLFLSTLLCVISLSLLSNCTSQREDRGIVFVAVEKALGQPGPVRDDLIRRGLYTAPVTAEATVSPVPGEIKIGEIEKLVKQGVDGNLIFGPAYSPHPFAVEPWLTHGPEAPDDIVIWMFAIDYRGNMQQNGTYPPPVIKSEGIQLTSSTKDIYVNYRKIITTKAGEIRNILFDVTPGNALQESHNWNEDTLRLRVIGVPPEMSFTQQGFFAHVGTLNTVLVIEIPEPVKSGLYEFSIGIEFEGRDYGTVPCTIEVTG
jgi:hypothetical protein